MVWTRVTRMGLIALAAGIAGLSAVHVRGRPALPVAPADLARESRSTALTPTAASDSQSPPAMVRNGRPGEMHKRLNALVGEWSVDKATYIAGGTADSPIIAN